VERPRRAREDARPEVAVVARPWVLVVDDDASVAALVAAVLRREGLEVETAPDGEAALRRLEAGRPQLVVTDMTMPGLSGLELARAAEAAGHGVPFLVMSAYLDPDTERALIDEPAVGGVLRKPFDLARLVRDVRAVLDRSRVAACWALVRWDPGLVLLTPRAPRPASRPQPWAQPWTQGGSAQAESSAC
jgi:DNA-binding response OmpR family regulator